MGMSWRGSGAAGPWGSMEKGELQRGGVIVAHNTAQGMQCKLREEGAGWACGGTNGAAELGRVSSPCPVRRGPEARHPRPGTRMVGSALWAVRDCRVPPENCFKYGIHFMKTYEYKHSDRCPAPCTGCTETKRNLNWGAQSQQCGTMAAPRMTRRAHTLHVPRAHPRDTCTQRAQHERLSLTWQGRTR